MKNTNLKYVIVALVLAVQWSCSTNDAPTQADKQIELKKIGGEVSIEEDIHTYVLDGKVITDKTLIDKSIANAFHTHYDFPKNKAVICSNQRQFDKYLIADPEFKQRLEGNAAAAKIEDAKQQFNTAKGVDLTNKPASTGASLATVYPWTDFDVANYSKGFMNSIIYRNVSIGYNQYLVSNQTSCASVNTNSYVYNYVNDKLEGKPYSTFVYVGDYLGKIYSNSKLNNNCIFYLRNCNNSVRKTRTYFSKINYQGAATSKTLDPNTQYRLGAAVVNALSFN